MQLWTVPSHAALFVWSQNLMACKRRGNIPMHLQESAVLRTFTEYHKGFQGQEELRWIKSKLKFDFFSPKSKISCVKKSSLVLASISKKCKLKFDKNIIKCRIFQLEFPVKHWTTHTMLYPGQTGASEATHIREAWVQLKVSYAQFIPGQHFGKSNIHLYTET